MQKEVLQLNEPSNDGRNPVHACSCCPPIEEQTNGNKDAGHEISNRPWPLGDHVPSSDHTGDTELGGSFATVLFDELSNHKCQLRNVHKYLNDPTNVQIDLEWVHREHNVHINKWHR